MKAEKVNLSVWEVHRDCDCCCEEKRADKILREGNGQNGAPLRSATRSGPTTLWWGCYCCCLAQSHNQKGHNLLKALSVPWHSNTTLIFTCVQNTYGQYNEEKVARGYSQYSGVQCIISRIQTRVFIVNTSKCSHIFDSKLLDIG